MSRSAEAVIDSAGAWVRPTTVIPEKISWLPVVVAISPFDHGDPTRGSEIIESERVDAGVFR